jgi:hypothetical protein
MLIAEDLLLLLTDDATGKLSAPAAQVDLALAGANLVELALMDKVDLSHDHDVGKPGRIVVRDPTPAGDTVLDDALATLGATEGKKPATVVRSMSKDLRTTLYERLAARGVVRAERGRVLGLFPTHTWPAQEPSHEADVRRLIVEALVEQQRPDARTASLIALLHALREEDKVVDLDACGLSRRELRARAAAIAEGNWVSEAVHRAIDELLAEIAAIVAASSVVVQSGSH